MQSANPIVLITPMPIVIGSAPLQRSLQWGCTDNPLVRRLYAPNLADRFLPTLHHNDCKEGGWMQSANDRIVHHWSWHPSWLHLAQLCSWISNWRVSFIHFVCRLLSPHPTAHNNISKQVGCMQSANHRIVESNQAETNQIILITPTPTALT